MADGQAPGDSGKGADLLVRRRLGWHGPRLHRLAVWPDQPDPRLTAEGLEAELHQLLRTVAVARPDAGVQAAAPDRGRAGARAGRAPRLPGGGRGAELRQLLRAVAVVLPDPGVQERAQELRLAEDRSETLRDLLLAGGEARLLRRGGVDLGQP